MTNEVEVMERIRDLSKERQLLNLILESNQVQIEYLPGINTDIFFSNSYLGFFEIMRNMFLAKKKIGRNTVASHISQNTPASDIQSYMNVLKEVIAEPPFDAPEILIHELTRMFKSRKVYKEIFMDANKGFLLNAPIEKLIEDIGNTLFSLEGGGNEVKVKDLCVNTLDEILNPKEEEKGLDIGLTEFDQTYGGIKPDTYITIGAESGTGKTAFLIDIIHRLFERHESKIAVCFFSMEMSEKRIMKRMLSRHANVNSLMFDTKRVSGIGPLAKQRLYNAATDIRSWNLKIVYETMDIQRIKMKARQFILQNPGKKHIFLVDHIGKIESTLSDMRVSTIRNSAGLKSLCVDHKATVIALSQLLKELASPKYKATYHRPDESFIMESGSIKADSDILGMLWRPGSRFDSIAYGSNDNWNPKGKMIFLNEKNRDGIEKTDMIFGCDMGTSKLVDVADPFGQ
jgi:replicative DNA helicase